MGQQVDILGIKVHHVTMKQGTNILMEHLNRGDGAFTVFTPNAEMVMVARENKHFFQLLNQGNLVVADGIGVVKAAKSFGTPLPERVAGYDLALCLFEKLNDTPYTVYFLGGAPGIAEKAKENLLKKYPHLNIVGCRDGYFKEKDVPQILEELQNKTPDVVLVCLGMIKQETFIQKYKEQLPVKVWMGLGGSLDGYAGNVKRAPQIFIRLHLEWLHRLLRQPSRIGRMMVLPKFMFTVSKEKRRRKKCKQS